MEYKSGSDISEQKRLMGRFFNVMGLPVQRLYRELKAF